jgi:hypothetical protein
MKGKWHIYILEVDGQYRVRPAVATVGWPDHEGGNPDPPQTPPPVANPNPNLAPKRGQIGIRNLTACPLVIVFPPGLLQGSNVQGVAGGAKVSLDLVADADGIYPYAVNVVTPNGVVPAVGESGPSIIIDP